MVYFLENPEKPIKMDDLEVPRYKVVPPSYKLVYKPH